MVNPCHFIPNVACVSPSSLRFPSDSLARAAETAYPWGGQETPGSEFPWTPAGQATFQRTMFQRAHDAGLGGVAWWGGEEFDQNTVSVALGILHYGSITKRKDSERYVPIGSGAVE